MQLHLQVVCRICLTGLVESEPDAEAAARSNGHSAGYMPRCAITHIVGQIVDVDAEDSREEHLEVKMILHKGCLSSEGTLVPSCPSQHLANLGAASGSRHASLVKQVRPRNTVHRKAA